MRPLVVEPPGVVELVRDVAIVAHVTLAIRCCDLIARPTAADRDEALAVRRPLEHADAVLEVRQNLRLAPVRSKHADLRPGWFGTESGVTCVLRLDRKANRELSGL